MEYVNVDVQTSKALKCFPINFSWKVTKSDGHSFFSFEVIVHILIVEAPPTPFHILNRVIAQLTYNSVTRKVTHNITYGSLWLVLDVEKAFK